MAKRQNKRAKGGAKSGVLRAKRRSTAAYRATVRAENANAPQVRRTRATIDKAVARGAKLRSQIESKIERLLVEKD